MEKFNEKLKFFLLSMLILSALKICVGGNVHPVPPGAATDMLLQKFRGGGKTHDRIIFIKLGGAMPPPCPTSSGPHELQTIGHI